MVLPESMSGKGLLPSSQVALLIVSLHGERGEKALWSFFYKDPRPFHEDFSLMT